MKDVLLFILSVLVVIAVTAAIIYVVKYVRDKKALKQIRLSWGKKLSLDYKDTDMESISSYYMNSRNDYKGIVVDDITWNDLEMDKVYAEINRTLTTPGEECLYAMLRRPESDVEAIRQRNRMIEYFRTHPGDREKIQMELFKLGRERRIDITDFLYGTRDPAIGKKTFYLFLALLSAISLLLIIAGFYESGFSLMIIMFITNMMVINNRRKYVQSGLDALGYMVSLIGCGLKLCRSGTGGIEDYRNSLYTHCMRLKRSAKRALNVLYKYDNPILEYINILFMVELISFESSFKKLIDRKDNVLEIYRTIGLIDVCISVASYRESLDSWCFPELCFMEIGQAKIRAEAIYHPLLENPVANTASLTKPLLVTGSNASGKSTFLKTIAINAIFAQTIATTLSKTYKSGIFRIYSSMALKDSIEHGESYYIAEVKSLKRIIEAAHGSLPVLCVIDEVLRGTNTLERIAASSQVLSYLANKKVLCVAATHDLELCEILGQAYQNCHFQEKYTGNDIVFDYLLYPGKSNTRNAIKLLNIMGFPKSVVREAEKRAEFFAENGRWG